LLCRLEYLWLFGFIQLPGMQCGNVEWEWIFDLPNVWHRNNINSICFNLHELSCWIVCDCGFA